MIELYFKMMGATYAISTVLGFLFIYVGNMVCNKRKGLPLLDGLTTLESKFFVLLLLFSPFFLIHFVMDEYVIPKL